ncbi:uncharacterized protein BBA_00542 [Beauveria bassiana ARSEF 2860]|uniref:Uncharacterized protein n=1 Tax=Beauveria bassiana (strain ARSEF 2860) TaxID=655819 RepID=J4UWZ7_BEAB2|nr:uncharacterized protein BBA_00542 [Beauveria bassiana ARSEF 2860]EJP70912.1 hypothetical protein BBA_00542 [Beauveria bassiana ARSEF 2860]
MLTNYDDPPEIGEKILGETLYFNGSLFSEKELAAGPQPGLSFAASTGSSSSGCCWIRQVPENPSTFPDCPPVDAANLSLCRARGAAHGTRRDYIGFGPSVQR